jgi:hypothetical protein
MDRRTVAGLAIDTLDTLGLRGQFTRMASHTALFQKLKILWVFSRFWEGFTMVPEGLDDSQRIGIQKPGISVRMGIVLEPNFARLVPKERILNGVSVAVG